MINKTVFFAGLLLCATITSYASEDAKTIALHAEITAQDGDEVIVTDKTAPTLCNLIREVAQELSVKMPRYIKLYNFEYYYAYTHGTTNNGFYNSTTTMHKGYRTVGAATMMFGDIQICKQLIAGLSYNEIRGVIAVALAAEVPGIMGKEAAAGLLVVALTAWWSYDVYKTYGKTVFPPANRTHYSNTDTGEFAYNMENITATLYRTVLFGEFGMLATLISAAIAGNLIYKYTQKKIDLAAARAIGKEAVVSGIEGVEKVKESLFEEGVFSRMLKDMRLKSFIDRLTYPVRAYTPEERIAYVMQKTV
ncbi:MAG: hypothetical protein WCE21_00775 [Candidatus Babeliales bacterium]